MYGADCDRRYHRRTKAKPGESTERTDERTNSAKLSKHCVCVRDRTLQYKPRERIYTADAAAPAPCKPLL